MQEIYPTSVLVLMPLSNAAVNCLTLLLPLTRIIQSVPN